MHKNVTRVLAVMAAGAGLAALGVAGAGASGAAVTRASWSAAGPEWGRSHAPAIPGAQRWVRRYNSSAGKNDGAVSVAISPTGKAVFVTGTSTGATSGADYATVAYDAATGARLWAARYNGPASMDDTAVSVAVSPGGAAVFVTGTSVGATSGDDYATVAYDAATGRRLWTARYDDPASMTDMAVSVAASPAGGKIFVTGTTFATSGTDFTTVAYDAATGAQLWASHSSGIAYSLALSPSGGEVFVTGDADSDYATVAYDAATGARVWARRYGDLPNGGDQAASVAVSPAGGRVFVTGFSYGAASGSDYATVAYDAATGARLWARRYNGPGHRFDRAFSVAVSPGGRTVFVTGTSTGATSGRDYATIAYSTATGKQMWVRRYNGPANGFDRAAAVAVSPDGKTVFVTGTSAGGASRQDYATIAYSS